MKKQDFLKYFDEKQLHKYIEFDGYTIKIYVEDEESSDKWYTLISTNKKNSEKAYEYFTKKFPNELINLIAPSHLSYMIIKPKSTCE